jgi:hypothetical protein
MPSGKIEITSIEEINVSAYEKAQVVDNNLVAENIVKDVTILGVTGTFEGGSGGNTLKNLLDATKSASYLFFGYAGESVENLIQYNDTENVTDARNIFNAAKNIKRIKLNTNKVTNIQYAFTNATNLVVVDISHYNLSGSTNSRELFSNCYSLKAVIIRSFNNYTLRTDAFNNCYWLLGQQNASHNPNGEQGYIYVPRDMIETLQSATNWSVLQFRALEDYTVDGTTTGEFDDEKAGLV